jgi:hypothetical protein
VSSSLVNLNDGKFMIEAQVNDYHRAKLFPIVYLCLERLNLEVLIDALVGEFTILWICEELHIFQWENTICSDNGYLGIARYV